VGVHALPLLFLLTAVAMAVGVARARRPWLDAAAVLGLPAVVLGVGVVVARGIDPGVPAGRATLGVVVGAVSLGGFPAVVYYVVGRLLARRPAIAIATWFLAVVPVGSYFVVALIVTTWMVGCPPGAYECPV
jgi:hypothetical protein